MVCMPQKMHKYILVLRCLGLSFSRCFRSFLSLSDYLWINPDPQLCQLAEGNSHQLYSYVIPAKCDALKVIARFIRECKVGPTSFAQPARLSPAMLEICCPGVFHGSNMVALTHMKDRLATKSTRWAQLRVISRKPSVGNHHSG